MNNKCVNSFSFILGSLFGVIILSGYFKIGYLKITNSTNNIEQVGHPNATAHIQCYENGKTIFNGFVSDLTQDKYGNYRFTQEHTNKRITISANCLIEE